jgi:hypothetical protein
VGTDDLMTSSSSFIKRILRSKWTHADSSSSSDKFSCFLLSSLDRENADLEKDPKEGNPFLVNAGELSCMLVNRGDGCNL